MSFNHIVMQNILRDKWTYISYFLSSVFSILVFYLFTITAFHPLMAEIDTESTLGIAMLLASFVVYIFSFVFIAYSLYSFLKKKTKSIGVFIITGASMKQVRQMIFRENMFVGLVAIVTSIIIGLVIAPIFLMIAKQVFQADDFQMYVPIVPTMMTIILFAGLFFVTSLFMTRFINKEAAIQLLKSEATPEKSLTSMPIRTTVFTLIALGLASMIKINEAFVDSLGMLYYVVLFLAILIAIYLLIKHAFVIWIRIAEKSDWYKKQTNMLFVANIKAKAQSYTHIVYLLTILLLAVFLATSVLYSSLHGVKEQTEAAYPYGYQYTSLEANSDEQRQEHLSFIEDTFQEEGVDYDRFDFTVKVDEDKRIGFVALSAFNELPFHDEQTLAADEFYAVAGSDGVEPSADAFDEGLSLVGSSDRNLLVTGFLNAYYVVPDDVFAQIEGADYDITAYEFADWTEQQAVIETIDEEVGYDLDKYLASSKVSLYEAETFVKRVMFFIGFMLSLIFLSAAMSIIYFYLQTTFASEKEKFMSVRKIGLSTKEIRTIVTKELALLIFVPFVQSFVMLFIILLSIRNLISTAFMQMTLIGVCIFFVLFLISFFLTRHRYVNMLIKE